MCVASSRSQTAAQPAGRGDANCRRSRPPGGPPRKAPPLQQLQILFTRSLRRARWRTRSACLARLVCAFKAGSWIGQCHTVSWRRQAPRFCSAAHPDRGSPGNQACPRTGDSPRVDAAAGLPTRSVRRAGTAHVRCVCMGVVSADSKCLVRGVVNLSCAWPLHAFCGALVAFSSSACSRVNPDSEQQHGAQQHGARHKRACDASSRST